MSTERSSPIDEKAHAEIHEVAPQQEPTGGLLSAWNRKDHSSFFAEVCTFLMRISIN